jgi:hypothetical protein
MISDRQLPPGHDPGADSGEAANGRQRGSRPLDILVECRCYDRPRRDEQPNRDDHHDNVGFAPDEPGPPRRTSWAGQVKTITAITAIMVRPVEPEPRRRGSRQSRRRRWTHAHRASVTNGEGHGGHGQHGGPGGAARRSRRTVTGETAPLAAAGPCGRPGRGRTR